MTASFSSSSPRHLSALRPPLDVPDIASFSYPQLEAVVEGCFQDQYDTVDEVFARYDADDEEALDLRLSHEYLLITALKLQRATTAQERDLWSQRYTQASIDTFGAPDPNEAAMIAAADLPLFIDASRRSSLDRDVLDLLLTSYSRLAELYDGTVTPLRAKETLSRVKHYIQRRYPVIRDALGGSDDEICDVDVIVGRFSAALALLHWPGWTVATNDTAQMSVSPQRKTIYVGRFLPAMTLRRVRALFAHEVLTHAQRSVNGARLDLSLQYGLPGYVTSEEGLGVVLEAAVDGALPARVGDRYVDIALAIGTSRTPPMPRFDLFRLTMARLLLRLGPEAEGADREPMRRVAWQHVNRIYRGSLGNEHVGVFTRDISYYVGFKKMIGYLQQAGTGEFDSALAFALSGKFDPTNPSHVAYVHQNKSQQVPSKETYL